MKRYKQFITEAAGKDFFNTFVNSIFTAGGNIDYSQAASLLVDDAWNYSGIAYRVEWLPVAEVMNYMPGGLLDEQPLTDYLAGKIQINRWAAYCKTLAGVEARIKFPGVVSNLSPSVIGIIYSIDSKAAIDLTKYDKTGDDISNRLVKTQEILSIVFHEIAIKNIDAVYYFGDSGWVFETDLSKAILTGQQQSTPAVSGSSDSEAPDLAANKK
jgi:hypothetical protein